MLIQSTFSYNDARNLSIYKILISDHMIGLNHLEVTTLPASRYHAIYTIQ